LSRRKSSDDEAGTDLTNGNRRLPMTRDGHGGKRTAGLRGSLSVIRYAPHWPAWRYSPHRPHDCRSRKPEFSTVWADAFLAAVERSLGILDAAGLEVGDRTKLHATEARALLLKGAITSEDLIRSAVANRGTGDRRRRWNTSIQTCHAGRRRHATRMPDQAAHTMQGPRTSSVGSRILRHATADLLGYARPGSPFGRPYDEELSWSITARAGGVIMGQDSDTTEFGRPLSAGKTRKPARSGDSLRRRG